MEAETNTARFHVFRHQPLPDRREVLRLKTLATKKGRANPSLTIPKTLLNETI
jgi:hypothetical protein